MTQDPTTSAAPLTERDERMVWLLARAVSAERRNAHLCSVLGDIARGCTSPCEAARAALEWEP